MNGPEVLDGGLPAEPGEVGQLLARAGGDRRPVVDLLVSRSTTASARSAPIALDDAARAHLGSAPSCRLRQPSFQKREPLSAQRTLVPVSSDFERLRERRLAAAVAADDERQPGPGPQLDSLLSGPMPRKPRTPMASRYARGDSGGSASAFACLCPSPWASARLLRPRRLDTVVEIAREPRLAVARGQDEIGPGLGVLALRDQAIEELRLGGGDGGHADTLIRPTRFHHEAHQYG